jgi:hypothetical protein
MHCDEFLAHYSTWRDGLEPLRAEAMDAHLEGCASCRAHDEALRHGVAALRGHELVPSSTFERRLARRLARAGAAHRPPHVAPLAATAMALLMLLVIGLASRRPPVSTAQAETEPPVLARPVANAGPPFIAFVPIHQPPFKL